MATEKLYDKFHDFTIPPNSNSIETLHALEDTNNQMAEIGMGIPDAFLHARSVCALPVEYDHVKATLQVVKNRDRAEIIRMVGTRYSTLPQKKRSQRSSQPPEQAFFSSKSGRRSGARRGRGRGRGGTKGHGRGGSSSRGEGSSSGGGNSSTSSASGSSHGGGNRPPGRCWRCNRTDHIGGKCTTKESGFIAECARCSCFVHEESTCPSDAAVLAMELPMSEEDLAVEVQTFVAKETGKCSVVVGEEVEGGELGKHGVQYMADSAATCNMTPDTDSLTNYRECSRPLGLANGRTTSIAGYDDLTVCFRSDNGWVHIKLNDVIYAPLLSYDLILLPSLAFKGHTFAGDKDGVSLKLKREKTVHFPLIQIICCQYKYCPEAKGRVVDTACAVIAPGQAKALTTLTNINTFHCTYGRTHEVLLKKTAGQQGVNLSGELHECRGCSLAKRLRKPIARSTHTIAD